jgi:hypothetical protein
MEETKMQIEERMTESAETELIEHKAVLTLLKSDSLACEIHIAGMRIGVINNADVVPVIKKNMKEINKYLAGLENDYE